MNTEQTRSTLLEKQRHLQKRVTSINVDFKRGREQDFAEFATESENDEVLYALKDEAISELEQITKALHLLDCGRYGKCLDCGEDIEEKRLEALPYTVLCSNCVEE